MKWEKPREAREGSPNWPANGREFEAVMFGCSVFLKGKNLHSIVIVVLLHVSKFYRVLKKLTAYQKPGRSPDKRQYLEFPQVFSTS
jgi:hypothetical protein